MASEPTKLSTTVRFEQDFELDLRSYELRRAGRLLKTERIPMHVLALLVENNGQLVSRDQIIERVWGKDVFLDTDNSINAAIRKIRQVLKDDPEQPRYVQTITGRGYRFIGKIIAPAAPQLVQPTAESLPGAERLLGRKVSHYRILKFLGGGGMGVVYEAEDLKLGRRVAIKFLPGELASDPKAFERLEREARAASALDHRNICSVYQLGEFEGQPFIVLQLLEGRTLREWIEQASSQDRAQRLRELVGLAMQIADGLEAAHQKGIIHRDIKPANIFVTSRGEVKILDFGVAKFMETPEVLPMAASSGLDNTGMNLTLTRTGVSVGTPSYLSPEQIRGEKLDARTDIFSFGLVLYEMATGEQAFAGNAVSLIREAVLNTPAAPVREVRPDLPSKLEAIIAKALEKDRERRFQSAKALRSALEQVRDQFAGAKPANRRMWMMAATVAVVLALAAFIVAGALHGWWRAEFNSASPAGITPRRSIAVLGFKNLSGKPEEEWISTALGEMFSTELAAGQQVRTIPGESVARMKLDLSLPAAESYSRETLNKIGTQLNTDMVLVGSYLALGKESGSKVRIDLQLQDAHAGEAIAAISQAGEETDLAGLVSLVGLRLRQALGVAAASSSEAGALQASIPTNPEAARLYAEGLDKLRNFDALGARDLLEKAIAADPNHALSHSALAEAWAALGYDSRAQQQAQKAYELSAHLSREDRLLIEGRYHELNKEFPPAIDIYRTLYNFFPDRIDYGLRQAATQIRFSQLQDALATVARIRKSGLPGASAGDVDLIEARALQQSSDYKDMQKVASLAAEKGRAQGASLLVAAALLVEGSAWDNLGDGERATAALTEARQLSQDRNPSLAARADLYLGHVFYDQGDYSRALVPYQQALELSRKIGDKVSTAQSVESIANTFYEQGKLQEAKLNYEEELRIDREIENRSGIASSLNNLANLVEEMGDLPAAAKLSEQGAQTFAQIGSKRGEATALSNWGNVLIDQGDLQGARSKIEAALVTQEQIGYKRGAAFSLDSLAEVARLQDRLNEARKMAEQATSIRKELNDQANLARSQVRLAEIALDQEEATKAESLAQAAAQALSAKKIFDGCVAAEAVLAQALLAEKKTNEARAAVDRSLEFSRQTTDHASLFTAKMAAAQVDAASGAFARAIKSFRGLLPEEARFGYANFELQTRLLLGEIEIRSGNVEAGTTDLKELRNLAQSKGFALVARKASEALGKH